MFCILHKSENKKPVICGSVKIVSKITGISHHILYENFGRKGKMGYENELFKIIKTEKVTKSNIHEFTNLHDS